MRQEETDRSTRATDQVKVSMANDTLALGCVEKDLDACQGRAWPHLAGYATAVIMTARPGTPLRSAGKGLTLSDLHAVSWGEVSLFILIRQMDSKSLEASYLKLLSEKDSDEWFLLRLREELIARGVW